MLIVGLGNYGEEYKFSRHNVGFRVVDYLLEKHKLIWEKNKLWDWRRITIGKKELILIKLHTFINLSGELLILALKKYNKDTSDLLIIHDDLNLAFGKLRIKKKGSSGGHKGVKSIIEHIGEEFLRLKIGVGAKGKIEGDWASYLLANFNRKEEEILRSEILPKATDLIESFSYFSE